MNLDLRLPIGLMFSVFGVMLTGYGFLSDDAIYARSLGINMNIRWGLVLLAFGLVMVYSASVALPDSPKGARLGELHFLTRHSLSIVIGLVAALMALQVPVAVWEKWAPWLFVGALVLLALVLVPQVGLMKNGAGARLTLLNTSFITSGGMAEPSAKCMK